MKIGSQFGMSDVMSRYFNSINSTRAQAVQKIASGKKFQYAAEDSSGLAMAKKLYGQITGTSTASKNAQDAVSMVQVADGALSKVGDMVSRMNELALRASNETLATEDRAALQQEYDSLGAEIDKVGQSTNFNGLRLFDNSTYTMQIGIGKSDTIDLKFGEISAEALGVGKADLSTAKGAGEASKLARDAMNSISKQRGTLGAAEKGLQSTISSLDKSEESLMGSLSKMMDTNYGDASSELGMTGALSKSTIAMMKNSQYLMQYNVLSLLMR